MSSEPVSDIEAVALQREVILGPGPVVLRWNAQQAALFPELVSGVAAFDAGDRSAAVSCAQWLREQALDPASGSVTRLVLDRGEIRGFYALAAASVELTGRQRKAGRFAPRPTQPAFLITRIARASAAQGMGTFMVKHAAAVSRRLSEDVGATTLVLDPFDAETAEMWMDRHGFKKAASSVPGRDWPRLYVPLY